jgi:hypothetical protein
MRATAGLLAVLLGCGPAAAADEKYASKEGKFKVAFPKDAKVTTKKQDAGNNMSLNLFVAEQGGDRAFAVMYMVLPEMAKDVPAKTIMDGGMKGMVTKGGGKVAKQKDMTFGKDKLPAREVVVEKPTGKQRVWMIVDGQYVYILIAGGKEDFATGKEATAFLESFEITK